MRPHPLLVVNDVALAAELARGRLPPTLVTQKSEWKPATPSPPCPRGKSSTP